LRYYKGLHLLLDAVQDTDFQVVIVGIGKLRTQLENQARKLGLKNIHFMGQVSEEDKVALLQLCYAYVFPSHLRSEAFGISLLESAIFGKPMISTEIGTGTSFINMDGKTGIVVPPASPEALRKAMQDLIDNPAMANEYGKNAEKRYRQYFTGDKHAEAYLNVYRKLLTGKKRA